MKYYFWKSEVKYFYLTFKIEIQYYFWKSEIKIFYLSEIKYFYLSYYAEWKVAAWTGLDGLGKPSSAKTDEFLHIV